MPQIGKFNEMKVLRRIDIGLSLDGENLGSILLPRKEAPDDAKAGDILNVFLYLDSEDRLIATTRTPKAQAGEFAMLKVAAVNRIGAFLDWGLPKDLLVPYHEQLQPMEVGKSYLVRVYVDKKTQRLAATNRIEKQLDLKPANYRVGEAVELTVYGQFTIGYKAIINGEHSGVIYRNEVFQQLRVGQSVKGFIKKVREDGKIDLTLQKTGYGGIDNQSAKILAALQKEKGFLPLNDKSAPEIIYKRFGISKKVFKKAVGALYKSRLIKLEKNGIRLNDSSNRDNK